MQLGIPITYYATSEDQDDEVETTLSTVKILSKCKKLREFDVWGCNDVYGVEYVDCDWSDQDVSRFKDLMLNAGLQR